jgi:hypothetical protein
MTDVRKNVARELRRVKEEVRENALRAGEPAASLPPAPPAREPEPASREDPPPAEPAPSAPDRTLVNESWRAEPRVPRGLKGLLFRLLDRLLRPRFEAQRTFNAHQAQLDNAILRHLEERSAATHRHYDRLLGIYGRHLDEVNERHVILEKELVGHVEELIRRIDLVLARAERGRVSLEHELSDVRRQLEELRASMGRS